MLNLCVLEFVRNENGFFVAAQSAATACLRSCLKGRGVHSIAYTDDTLPSLNDLAEDVLSIADDGLVLVANEENKLLVNALACRIAQLLLWYTMGFGIDACLKNLPYGEIFLPV